MIFVVRVVSAERDGVHADTAGKDIPALREGVYIAAACELGHGHHSFGCLAVLRAPHVKLTGTASPVRDGGHNPAVAFG
jgi:hypothetical protein